MDVEIGDIEELEDCWCVKIPGHLLTVTNVQYKGNLLKVDVSRKLNKNVIKWLNENFNEDEWCHDELSGYSIAFIELESAIAFKLRWL